MRDRTYSVAGEGSARTRGIPDMRAIGQLPIGEVAHALDLRFGPSGNIHCWHPDKHEHGDRTASVGIQKKRNRVKCFGCGSRPIGPLDMVIDVLGVKPKDAALWIAERFDVPRLPPGKHIQEPRRFIHSAGFETATGLLVRSGLWATLSPFTQRLVPVLLELAEFKATAASEEREKEKTLHVSYRALSRYASSGDGRPSQSSVAKGLAELEEIGFLARVNRGGGLLRAVGYYVLTPFSESVQESANTTAAELKQEIAVEKELRKQERRKRLDATATVASIRKTPERTREGARGITKYDSLSCGSSVQQFDGSVVVASNAPRP